MNGTTERWKRPDSVPYPSVWCKFQGLKEINGVIPKFWIQDVAEEQFDVMINYMVNGFANDEPLCKYSKITSDPESVEELYFIYRVLLKDKLGLICYMENPDPNGEPIVAGMNLTHIKQKVENFPEPKGKVTAMVIDMVDFFTKINDAFEATGCDEFLSAIGLYVLPEFRGQGIGLELLKVREPLCKAVGIKATVTMFTAIGSQILAGKAGFQDLTVMSYVDLQQVHPSSKFPGIEKHTKNLKYMYKIYQ